MMVMSVKEYLERARHLDDAINSKLAELSHLRDLSTKIGSSRMEEHVSGSRPQEAPFAKWVERIVDKEQEINGNDHIDDCAGFQERGIDPIQSRKEKNAEAKVGASVI